jgi:signal transduction histidine kinase
VEARVAIDRGSREIVELSEAFNSMADSLARRNKELQGASTALKVAYDAADERNRAYLEMLGFVTHELKSPLASIVFAIGSMREGTFGELSQEQESLLKAAASSADYLNDTIANYLNLSRVEEGALQLRLAEVDYRHDIIEPVVARFTELAADVEMAITVEANDKVRGFCDHSLMTSVFQNLLSNALKYGTRGGKILISGRQYGFTALQFSVWNQGIGFDAKAQARLFTRFARLGTGRNNTKSGTGLGLFVARQIVEKHGGRIWAESEPNAWARFAFTLPRDMRLEDRPMD